MGFGSDIQIDGLIRHPQPHHHPLLWNLLDHGRKEGKGNSINKKQNKTKDKTRKRERKRRSWGPRELKQEMWVSLGMQNSHDTRWWIREEEIWCMLTTWFCDDDDDDDDEYHIHNNIDNKQGTHLPAEFFFLGVSAQRKFPNHISFIFLPGSCSFCLFPFLVLVPLLPLVFFSLVLVLVCCLFHLLVVPVVLPLWVVFFFLPLVGGLIEWIQQRSAINM